MKMNTPIIVISHSHKDDKVASILVKYIVSNYKINSQKIRCTSIPDHGLEFGTEVPQALKNDLQNCDGVIALLSYAGLHATYVKYELGAAWISEKPILPILGPDAQDYEKHLGPIKELKYIKIDEKNVKDILLHDLKSFMKKIHVEPKNSNGNELDNFIKDFISLGNVQVDFENTDVKIISPQPKAELNRKIDVQIERNVFPPEGFLWVAVGNKNTGEYWPKVHLAVNETTCSIIEGGNPEPGDLGVWLIGVGVAGHRKFEEWYTNGTKGRGFPPFNIKTKTGRAPGAEFLTASDDLIINKSK